MKTTSDKDTTVQFFELEKVRFVIKDACGLDIAYAFEDLVFSEHGLFILQFSKTATNELFCWFNKECFAKERAAMLTSLIKSGELNGLTISSKGLFTMSQKDGQEQIDLQFDEQSYFLG